jgi:RNA polymerase sigma factor (sigma-70 family)
MSLAEQAQGSSPSVIPFPTAAEDEILSLTKRAVVGDELAAREFFERYCDRIYRYAIVLARGQEDLAREVVSNTMIKGLRHLKPMASDADVWRWLTQIARTTFIDHCRKNNRRIDASAELSESIAIPSADSTLSAALNECLEELAADEREIVERFYFEDQTQNELAAGAQTTRKAVESRLARIRQKLRQAILRKLA